MVNERPSLATFVEITFFVAEFIVVLLMIYSCNKFLREVASSFWRSLNNAISGRRTELPSVSDYDQPDDWTAPTPTELLELEIKSNLPPLSHNWEREKQRIFRYRPRMPTIFESELEYEDSAETHETA